MSSYLVAKKTTADVSMSEETEDQTASKGNTTSALKVSVSNITCIREYNVLYYSLPNLHNLQVKWLLAVGDHTLFWKIFMYLFIEIKLHNYYVYQW